MAVSALARGRWSLGIARQRQINHRSSQSVPPLEVGGLAGTDRGDRLDSGPRADPLGRLLSRILRGHLGQIAPCGTAGAWA